MFGYSYYCAQCKVEFRMTDQSGTVYTACPVCHTTLDANYRAFTPVPRFEAVWQWEQRNGAYYPDSAPVYVWVEDDTAPVGSWVLLEWHDVTNRDDSFSVVAGPSGAPPGDANYVKGWMDYFSEKCLPLSY